MDQEVTSRDNNEFARIMLKFSSVAMGVQPASLRQGAERPKSLPLQATLTYKELQEQRGRQEGMILVAFTF